MPAYFHHWLDQVPDLTELSRGAPDSFPYLLESTAGGPLGGHSILLHAAGPKLVARRGRELTGPGEGSTFFARLDSWFRQESDTASSVPRGAPDRLPFRGGWFVYLGYEMAAEIEPSLTLPAADTGLPDALAQRCPGALIVFHEDSPGGVFPFRR